MEKSTDENGDTFSFARAKAHALSQPNYFATITPATASHVRTRPMQVLCLGRERTGTLSLRTALLYLGYYDVYHMAVPLMENPADCEAWVAALDGKFGRNGKRPFGRADWDALLAGYTAVTDQPCALFAEELMAAYPEAKVILTVRDSPQAWHRSVSETILALIQLQSPRCVRHPGWNPLYLLQRFFAPRMPGSHTHEFFEKAVEALEGDALEDEGVAAEKYLAHNARVRGLVEEQGREEDGFLEFNVKQGWGPLCEFLGKQVPSDGAEEPLPFPRVNDSQAYKENIARLRWLIPVGYLVNVLKVFGVPAVALGAWYFLRREV